MLKVVASNERTRRSGVVVVPARILDIAEEIDRAGEQRDSDAYEKGIEELLMLLVTSATHYGMPSRRRQ
jgi:hypothetical protein